MSILSIRNAVLATCGVSLGYAIEHSCEASNQMTAVVATVGAVALPIFYHVLSKVLSKVVTCVRRPSWNSPDWKVVLEWNFEEGKVARLLRAGDYLMTESIVNGQSARAFYEWRDKRMTTDLLISTLSKRGAQIKEDGSVSFLKMRKSALNDVRITEDEWGVTIVDTGRSEADPFSWGGHAVIIVESLEKGSYKIQRADLVKKDLFSDKVEVRLLDLSQMPKILSRSQTWIRSKDLVLRMLKRIEWEKEQTENGKPIGTNERFSTFMVGDGDDSENRSYNLINCMTWARRRVFLADIDMPSSLNAFSWETPRRYLGSKIKAVAQEAFGLVSKAAILTGIVEVTAFTVGGTAAAGLAFPALVTMAPVTIPVYGIGSLFISWLKRRADRHNREILKNATLN